ncbi:SixA phosphatase family protein [Raineyella fluvialis]|uniref:Histidine phosphatase family protein n=1 Tax=Raineyella fluvialis TaxID=2662261 RepID=A0A5Q2FGT7_9ACTN|nr:histidine phosphatase family protein [Raineyella fluvialis]QGF23915.1 histidine phosphatase family protein [Raineyella fluvialis]
MEKRHAAVPAHVLYLLRHAKAEVLRAGETDDKRRLTDTGRRQAHAVGRWLGKHGDGIDLALCSEAVRTRETLEGLGVDAPATYLWDLYNAGADRILSELRTVDEGVRTLLVVGHAPGIPALASDLIDPADSDRGAKSAIAHHFPTATIVRLEFDGSWHDLEKARLTQARVD